MVGRACALSEMYGEGTGVGACFCCVVPVAAWGGEPGIGDGRGLVGSCGIDVSMGGRVL